MCWVCGLRHQDRDCTKESRSHTHEEPRRYKHFTISSSSLQPNTQDNHNESDIDRLLAAPSVGNLSHGGVPNTRPESLDGINHSQVSPVRIMHEGLPLRERLEAVHHRVIVSNSSREQHGAEKHQVELHQMGLCPPSSAAIWKNLDQKLVLVAGNFEK